jgi:hypothetical protein
MKGIKKECVLKNVGGIFKPSVHRRVRVKGGSANLSRKSITNTYVSLKVQFIL